MMQRSDTQTLRDGQVTALGRNQQAVGSARQAFVACLCTAMDG